MTIEHIVKEYVERLMNIYDIREAINITEWTVENITGMKRIDRVPNKKTQLNDITIKRLLEALEQLLQHKPVQYVLGEAWFYKMKFFVNEDVLIPRPETEELVEWIVAELKSKNAHLPDGQEKIKIIDIGTGSGCIAIALKKEFVDASVTAADISAGALSVAKQNAADQNVKIDLLEFNFLDNKEWNNLPVFDIIVSNPPYIPEKDKSSLEKNVVDYEPHLALFVSDDDPFIFYRKMGEFAVDHLKANGKIYVELNEKHSNEVKRIFSDYNFTSVIRKDIYGRERMICAVR